MTYQKKECLGDPAAVPARPPGALDESMIGKRMTVASSGPVSLSGRPQNYHWGKVGEASLVARLAGSFDPEKPYAELWVGAHPKSPAMVTGAGQDIALDRFIAENPRAVLGERVVETFGPTLPFLFKVLSIDRALSIQAHPDKALAKVLHARAPQHYPDDNHKPEIAVAVTNLDLLYGFQSARGLNRIPQEYPELGEVLDADLMTALRTVSTDREASGLVRQAYERIVTGDASRRGAATARMIERLEASRTGHGLRERSLLAFHAEYGAEDIGILSSLLMNIGTLPPGKAVFLGPNIAHAYLGGDLVECMANSDNVVRAGLTPKFQDISTLVGMLTYECGDLEPLEPQPSPDGEFVTYRTPAPEFRVEALEGTRTLALRNDGTMKLIFCLSGEGTVTIAGAGAPLRPGGAILVPAASPAYEIECREAKLFRISIP